MEKSIKTNLRNINQMNLSRAEILTRFDEWLIAWNEHNLEGVMGWMHDDILFENWDGSIINSKHALEKVWSVWFRRRDFKFIMEDVFIDETQQNITFSWQLVWPSTEKKYAGKNEVRRGVDLMQLMDGQILKKNTYSKTAILIDSSSVNLLAY